MPDLHFAFYGRICAVLYFFSAVSISLWQMIWYPSLAIPLGSYTLVSGLLVGLIELPICFACCGPCNKLAGYMRVVMGYWVVRGVLYAGLSAAGYVIYEMPVGNVQVINPSLLCVQILATVTAALYFVATGRCEPNPARTGDDSGRGAVRPTEQQVPVASAAMPPAVSAGQALFGAESGATAPQAPLRAVTATPDPVPPAATKAGLFSGGALFPASGSSKYAGFADDADVNPFLTS